MLIVCLLFLLPGWCHQYRQSWLLQLDTSFLLHARTSSRTSKTIHCFRMNSIVFMSNYIGVNVEKHGNRKAAATRMCLREFLTYNVVSNVYLLFSNLPSLPLCTGIGWLALTSCLLFPILCTTSTQCSCATGTNCGSKDTRRLRQHPSTWAQHWQATCAASSSWCCTMLSWSLSASPSLW